MIDLVVFGLTFHDTQAPYDDQPVQLYLMKCDSGGNRLWDHTYGNAADNETPSDLVELPDGGYLLMGYTYFDQTTPPFYNIKTFLLRTDSMGVQQYFFYLPGTNLDLTCITATSDGDYVMAGTKCNAAIDTCSVAVVKIDASGNILWQRELWPDSTHAGISILEDIVELPDGSLVGCSRTTPVSGGLNAMGLVMKTDASGYQLWNRVIDKTPAYDSFTRITACSDGGIMLTGQMQRDQLSDVWLVKIDSLGCDSAGCPEDIHTGITPVVNSSEDEKSAVLAAMPNPFSTNTLITFPPMSRESGLVVRDALGRSVRRVQLVAGSTSTAVDLGDQPGGVYVAELRSAGSLIGTVRLLKE